MEVFFGGTGSGYASVSRNTSCIQVTEGTSVVQLDCGDGATKSLFGRPEPKAIVITHMHPDHSGGLAFLLQTLHLFKHRNPLTLFVTESPEFIEQLLIHSYIFPESLGFDLEIVTLKTEHIYKVGQFAIRPYENNHMQIHKEQLNSHPELGGKSFCLCLSANGKRLVYSSDILNTDDLVKPLSNGADLLICEAAHIDIDCLDKFREKVGRIVLTHIPDREDIPEKWELAYDGLSINI